MDRAARATAGLDLGGRGLEIGPSYNPIVPKSSGAAVETVDTAPRDALVAFYAASGHDQALLDRIEEVDYVWTGGSLLGIIRDHGCFDYVIASHLIEHTVDLVEFWTDVSALLTPNGRLSLVVPDKRFTFDRFRPLTTIGEVLDGSHSDRRFHPVSAVVDHFALGVELAGRSPWPRGTVGSFTLRNATWHAALEGEAAALRQDRYVNVHRWVFTPESFAMLVDDLSELDRIDLEIEELHQEEEFEFFVRMRRRRPGWTRRRSRIESLLAIESELELVSPVTAEAERLRAENESLQQTIAAIERSVSWRATAPLRGLRRVTRRGPR